MGPIDNLAFEKTRWYDEEPKEQECEKEYSQLSKLSSEQPPKRCENEQEYRRFSQIRDNFRSDLRNIMSWSCSNGRGISVHVRSFFGCYCKHPDGFFKRAERDVDEMTSYAISLIKHEKDVSSPVHIDYLSRRTCESLTDFAHNVGYPHEISCSRIQ